MKLKHVPVTSCFFRMPCSKHRRSEDCIRLGCLRDCTTQHRRKCINCAYDALPKKSKKEQKIMPTKSPKPKTLLKNPKVAVPKQPIVVIERDSVVTMTITDHSKKIMSAASVEKVILETVKVKPGEERVELQAFLTVTDRHGASATALITLRDLQNMVEELLEY